MVFSQKVPARTLSWIVAALAMLPSLSATPCCCTNENVECCNTTTAYYVDGRLSLCDQMAWICPFDSCTQHLPEVQSSTQYGCECPCCCANGPRSCNGVQLRFAGTCRKKPSDPARQWHSGNSIGQDYPPTSLITGVISWAPSPTSTAAARCSLLCRFLL